MRLLLRAACMLRSMHACIHACPSQQRAIITACWLGVPLACPGAVDVFCTIRGGLLFSPLILLHTHMSAAAQVTFRPLKLQQYSDHIEIFCNNASFIVLVEAYTPETHIEARTVRGRQRPGIARSMRGGGEEEA